MVEVTVRAKREVDGVEILKKEDIARPVPMSAGPPGGSE